MSLLSICQAVARSIKIEIPNSIIGNTGEEPALLLACAQDEGEALARRPGGGWIAMQTEFDFLTVALGPLTGTVANTGPLGVAQVTLASTAGIVANTFYASGTGLPYNTIVQTVDSPTLVTLNQVATTLGSATDLIFSQVAYTLPVGFQRPIDNTMWDRSRYWQMRGPLSAQQWQFYKSSIFSRATIQRRFRFRQTNGAETFWIDPPPTDNGSALVFEYVSNAWCKNAGTGALQTQWLADSDLGVIDEYLIRLGVKARALERLGMAYDSQLAEYEREVSKAMATDGGAAILDLAPTPWPFLISPYGIQDGNYPGTAV